MKFIIANFDDIISSQHQENLLRSNYYDVCNEFIEVFDLFRVHTHKGFQFCHGDHLLDSIFNRVLFELGLMPLLKKW